MFMIAKVSWMLALLQINGLCASLSFSTSELAWQAWWSGCQRYILNSILMADHQFDKNSVSLLSFRFRSGVSLCMQRSCLTKPILEIIKCWPWLLQMAPLLRNTGLTSCFYCKVLAHREMSQPLELQVVHVANHVCLVQASAKMEGFANVTTNAVIPAWIRVSVSLRLGFKYVADNRLK